MAERKIAAERKREATERELAPMERKRAAAEEAQTPTEAEGKGKAAEKARAPASVEKKHVQAPEEKKELAPTAELSLFPLRAVFPG